MFRIPINDVYCGMRGFKRELYDRLDLRSPGMEFATEMIIKSGLHGASMSQVPITLHPDGRQEHGPHLRTFRDGWRTLRLFLVFSPKWTFFRPGLILIAIALVGYALAIPQVRIFGAALDVHTLLIASLAGLMGWQCVLLATLASIFAAREGMMPPHEKLEKLTVERGLGFGLVMTVIGAALIAAVIVQWWRVDFRASRLPLHDAAGCAWCDARGDRISNRDGSTNGWRFENASARPDNGDRRLGPHGCKCNYLSNCELPRMRLMWITRSLAHSRISGSSSRVAPAIKRYK